MSIASLLMELVTNAKSGLLRYIVKPEEAEVVFQHA